MRSGEKGSGSGLEVDMLSAPMATPISMLPVWICAAMSWIAFRPEEQKRFTLLAAVVLGRPAAREAARAMEAARGLLTWVGGGVSEGLNYGVSIGGRVGENEAHISKADILNELRVDI